MNEYVHLVGAEEVTRAASNMRAAAEQMTQAASSIDHTLEMFLRRYEELVQRQELVVAQMTAVDEKSIFERVFGKDRHG